MSHFEGEHSRVGADLAYGDGPDWGAGFGGAGTTAGRSPNYDPDDDFAARSTRSHRTGHSNHSGHSGHSREYVADERALLQLPEPRSRPRSLPPPVTAMETRHERALDRPYEHYEEKRRTRHPERDGYFDEKPHGRTRDRERGDRHNHHRSGHHHEEPTSPLDKAKEFMGDNFSHSRKGLGASMIGALVGGYAGRQANGGFERYRASRGHYPRRGSDEGGNRNQLISTMVGAAVGALGANAMSKRHSENGPNAMMHGSGDKRHGHRGDRSREREVHWESSSRAGGRGRDRDRDDDLIYDKRARSRGGPIGLEDREMHGGRRGRSDSRGAPLPALERARTRSGMRGGGRGLVNEVDPDAHSWDNVDDWVYDDRGHRASGRDHEVRDYR